MASVYFGRIVGSEGFSRVVAIKRMHPHLTESADFRAMFIDEARLAARINHPNVAQIIDLVAEDDELLLVMSYVHGVSVGGLLQAHHGPLRVPVALRIAIDALYGLHAAHTARDPSGAPLEIVHRDVSPQNLLTSVDGVTLVVDFGVAKAAARLQTSREGELKGKIRYMPPEQIRQGAVGPTTDVYALAVVLWEMLTAHRLFSGATEPAVLAQVLDGASTRPGALVAEIPVEVEDIVMRGLERDPSMRFPSALAMAEALEALGLAANPRDVAAVVSARARTTLEAREVAMQRIHDSASVEDIALRPEEISLADGTLSGRRDGSGARPASPPIELPIGPGVDERQKEAGSRGTRAVVLLAATAGAMTCVAAIVALANRGSVPTGTAAGTMAAAPPGQSATPPDRATAALPSAVPSLAQIANATASGVAPQVSAAPAASTRRASATLAPTAPVPPAVTPPRPPRPRPAPTLDCAQNPRVLGPDGVYQVRKECLGR